ncbi:hypothetical protein ASPZODRAFT_1412894 [Penicilliopsis zonata CBS 506.65]|uniref:Uncharacterized protein n=1 Tax=Penicilliopsis zonata CBS 506.65 TaxID=1073090 RepID=A0A1L9SPT1_9EURO|nr:hypothetical protein ASPZODRAFT_1412894 [Penicilliopsis zonata CBS 506.65]OJJ49178.1 hypothetical protein ASPZODRAFT_1412894 [Penicilliopsis zonata CBS 506.65]
MASPDLTSHHVNYLIWRYLQESGHGEAAVLLQRAWYHDPQSLPFAPYIKTHALVSLVQKGLQYHELEHSLDKDGNPTLFSPSDYFFGPAQLQPEVLKSHGGGAGQPALSPQAATKSTRDGGVINGHSTSEAGPLLPTAKKPRKVQGDDGASMDVDSNGVTHQVAAAAEGLPPATATTTTTASPPPAAVLVDGDGDVSMDAAQDQEPLQAQAQPPPAPAVTLVTGQSVGVQATPAKAADLSPDTAIFDVAPQTAHVTRTLWRPRDATAVVAAGEAFCDLWHLPSSSAPSRETLGDPSKDVSAVAWHPSGHKLAVATYQDMRGSITMYDVQGAAVDLLPEVPRMITGLHWDDHGANLVVVASDGRISELALWDDSLRPDEFPPPQTIDGSIYDFTWSDHPNQAFACGDGVVYQFDVDSRVHTARTFTSSDRPETSWTFIRCAKRGGGGGGGGGGPSTPSSHAVVATAASATADIWIPTHDMRMPDAHQGEITAIEFQPQTTHVVSVSSYLLASASTDDSVKIWIVDLDAKRFECIHRLFLGPSLPALALGFSPDGYALASASTDRLFIWNVERGGTPMATWTIPNIKKDDKGPDRAVNGHNGTADLMPDRSLSWDSDGKKLAFGFNNQMAVINLQR